jgi:heat shock protein HtpX
MTWFKRIGLLLAVNLAIMVVLNIVIELLGLRNWMTSSGINYQSLAVMCLIWGTLGSFISLMISKWMAKTMMGVELCKPTGSYGDLVQMVHPLARRAGLTTMPEVGVFDSPSPNAFATGPSKSDSLVAVSTGLLRHMRKNEVEAVLGHEVAHIANGDMVTMTLVQGVMNAFVMFFAYVAAFAVSQAMRGDRDDRGGGGSFLVNHLLVYLFQIVFGILGMIVTNWFSRYREYRADEGGAKFSGRDNMIASLQALQRSYPALAKTDSTFASLQISNRGSWLELFSTHPPLEKRIAALERLSL